MILTFCLRLKAIGSVLKVVRPVDMDRESRMAVEARGLIKRSTSAGADTVEEVSHHTTTALSH